MFHKTFARKIMVILMLSLIEWFALEKKEKIPVKETAEVLWFIWNLNLKG